jgi:aminoglycoside phosphotransferase (APT) family kinase protein
MMAGEKSEGVPITSSTVLKWSGLVSAIILGILGIGNWVATSNASIKSIEARMVVAQERHLIDLKATQDKLADIDKMSVARHAQQQGEIDEHKRRIDNSDKAVNDVTRKLDVAVAILERIEKKLP